MQDSEVHFLTDLTRTPQSAPVLGVIPSAFVTPIAVFEPLGDLLDVQLPEFLAGMKVVFTTVAIRTVRLGLGFGLGPCRRNPGGPFSSRLLSLFEPHIRWLLFGLGRSLTSLSRSGGISLIQRCYLTGNLLRLRLQLQPGGQVLQGVGSVRTRMQNAISQAVLNKVNTVGVRHLAEQTINMGTAMELVSILSLEGLQHAYQGLY